MPLEFGQSGKWLELLKEIAPHVTRVAVLLNRDFAAGIAQFGAIQAVAPSLGVEVSPIDLRDVSEMEHAIIGFASAPNGGLIISGAGAGARRQVIITLAARHRLPAVYPYPYQVASGGLTSYGLDVVDLYGARPGKAVRTPRGRSRPALRVRRPTRSGWRSIPKPPRRSAATFPQPCLLAPTR